MSKINVLVIPSENRGGVGFYRSTQPHIQLEKQFPEEFSVTIDMMPNFDDLANFDKYQIIHFHKGLFGNMEAFKKAMQYFKEKGIVTVMDIDDYWELNMYHPMYVGRKDGESERLIKENLKIADYVTTTTPLFANEIKKYNPNVFVIPNAIDPTDERFAVNKKPSDFVRVGLIMGSSHEHDMELLNNVSNGLPKDVLDKIQFVLCGFDLRGTIRVYEKDKLVETRKVEPKESVWYRYEKMLTNNYNVTSPEYKEFLEMFMPNTQYPNVDKEHYKRCWTKDMNHYYEHFSEIDVLLAPLKETLFNKVKSPLKVAEAAFSHNAIIASDFGPYTLDLHNAIEKGGIINKEGNALLVDEGRNHKDWQKYIIKIVRDPELLKQLQDNLYESVHEKFDLRNVTVDRAEFYKKIVNGE